MWWHKTFHQRLPQPPQEVFKLQGREPEQEDSPCPEEGLCNFHRRKQAPRRRYYHTGLARTGLEPVVVIHINEAPFDALVDLSANYSIIDSQLGRYLHLDSFSV